MSGHQSRSAPFSQRKPVVLIGAPSGAGKTELSHRIIGGQIPFFTELCGAASGDELVRYDLKVLPEDPPRNRVLIVECATHKFDELTRSEQWQRMINVIRESERVICVKLDVPRHVVVRQYFLRVFTKPKGTALVTRVLRVSKYRNTLIYALTSQLSRANAAWEAFVQTLVDEMPSVFVVRAKRSGVDYGMLLETQPLEPAPVLAGASTPNKLG